MQENSYTGLWERNGRSLTAAAIIALVGIGVFYFYVQSFFATFAVAFTEGLEKVGGREGSTGALSNKSIAVLRVIIFISQYACMLLPSWLIIRRLHTKHFFHYVRLKKISSAEIGLAAAGAVLLFPMNMLCSTFLVELLGIPETLLRANASLFTSYTPVEFAWLVLGIAATPAICEEVFFRGHVQRTLERSLSVHSVWIVGVIFGLFHFQPLGLASLALLGLYFGYLYYRSSSLYPSMAAHFINNTLALLFAYQPFVEREEWIASAKSGDLVLAAGVSLPFAAGIIFLFHKKTRTLPERIEEVGDLRHDVLFRGIYLLSLRGRPKSVSRREESPSLREWKRKRMLRNR